MTSKTVLEKLLRNAYSTYNKQIQRNGGGEFLFNKIVVANRGEIACKIIETAKKNGIKTVAVYSTADMNSKHVRLADEAVHIGPSEATQSYLNMEIILKVIKDTKSEAVHPGYGFLSENPDFVEMLEKENIIFIGPSSKSIKNMGDKLESKRIAKAAGVNIIPGFDGIILNESQCVEIANTIGYPVIIKASAGGGGKGMRIVKNDKDSIEGFKAATQEAITSFGDGRIIIEKLIHNPRHIEIQILGDKYGNVIYLNERECSIQRRNQKIIEESPSTILDQNTRELMGQQAVALCKKLGYYSAGTVEFLVDNNREFYFLEMNTRIQVEYALTECVTGMDLIYEMMRIAKGHALGVNQKDIKINGWAIESRIYAEDPFKDFGLPSTGHLYLYKEPRGEGVRCDSGIEEGSKIGIYYDSMMAKLICHGRTRMQAIEKSIKALDAYVIFGTAHNIPLLRDILTENKFIMGDTTTNFLQQLYPKGFRKHTLKEKDRKQLTAVALSVYAALDMRSKIYLNKPNLRISNLKNLDVCAYLFEKETSAQISLLNEDTFKIKMEGETHIVCVKLNTSNPILTATINNGPVTLQLKSTNYTGELCLIYNGKEYNINILPALAVDLLKKIPRKTGKIKTKIINAPMPGLIKHVFSKPGDAILQGEKICIIEAMKMQNSIVSEFNGKIKNVYICQGDTVNNSDILVEFE